MRPRPSLLLVSASIVGITAALSAQKVVKNAISSAGQPRTCYTFTPEGASSTTPLVILLHGSGRDGTSLVGPWQSLAKKEGFVIAAPDSTERSGWNLAGDGPDLLRDIVDALKSDGKIDPRRVYLFGHSAGGHHALSLALLESEYFAAAAVHAGALVHQPELFIRQARRKIPIGMWNGTDDRVVPIAAVRQTRDMLNAEDFGAVLSEIRGHTHDYYGRASDINNAVWAFFKDKRLSEDPKYREYTFGRESSTQSARNH